MSAETAIPIVVGVTGHRAVPEKDRAAISAAVREELKKLVALCPHSPFIMLNSLAEGGDLLCADAAEELGIPLIAVLPRPLEDYQGDFSESAKTRLKHHCARAEAVFTAPMMEPLPPEGSTRSFRFRQAGLYVAEHSHVLLALWDGGPGTEAACGTAETVDFALNGSCSTSLGLSPRSGANEAVIHIFTPRGEASEEAAGTVHVLGNWEAVSDLLRRTDDFNSGARKATPEASRLPEGAGDDNVLCRMERVSATAGQLSRQYARRFRRVLALLAVAAALLTFAFLLYDEAQAIWMILVCGVMLLAAWGCRHYAARSDCHRRYLEYRALAECLRVQTWLRYAGSRVQAARLLSCTQQEETAWVLAALCALSIGKEPETKHGIRSCWIDDQREYHRQAVKRAEKKLGVSENTVRIALILSVVLYLSAVGFELLCGGLFFRPIFPITDTELCRTVLKILLGTISAATLFVSNYYGRLSLPRTLSDHQRLERFYGRMSALIERYGQTEELLTLLAREELTENGNWCSYQRDNRPDISL
ncbi:MAG: hypothetical protein IJQ02_06140 [Oscillospiraceae bacterium]|nr:hypothetical protein [Oscillospiraceae bacterium]